VLQELSGAQVISLIETVSDRGDHTINARYPLLHHGSTVNFRTILHVLLSGIDGITFEKLRLRMPDQWGINVNKTVKRLVADGVVVVTEGARVRVADAVPKAFYRVVKIIAEHLGRTDVRFRAKPVNARKRVAAHVRAPDNAPHLFGPDSRLRNMMALAKHGPLHYSDLRRVVGGDQIRLDGRDNAPFGRGSVTRSFDTPEGPAVMLDSAFPLARELKLLLLRLEESFSLPALVRRHEAPKTPRNVLWNGDRTALFGSAIPTGILLSIGALGWTFEAIC
jgi:hypothetical protein